MNDSQTDPAWNSLEENYLRSSLDKTSHKRSSAASGTTSSKQDSAISSGGISHEMPTSENSTTTSKRQKVKELGHQAKIRTKSLLLGPHTSPEEVEINDDEYADDPFEEIHNPAFDPSQLIRQKPLRPEAFARSVLAFGKSVIHPQRAAKRTAASKIAIEDQPYLSREADLELLNAHENLNDAKSRDRSCNSNNKDSSDIEEELDRVQTIEHARESRKVAWVTSHYVKRVLVIPEREIQAPQKTDFYECNETSGQWEMDWRAFLFARNKHALQNFACNNMRHIDYSGQPPFDRQVMATQMERMLIASSPWQSWFSSLRQLYRWEDPVKTTRWFAVWFVIWYLDYCVTFLLAYVVYIVVVNRFRPKTAEALRDSYDRTRERGTAAYKFNELISRHGGDKWLDPALEEIGPKLQAQVTDIASFLEVLNNFYEWRAPSKTWATLFWFACAISLGILTSTQNSMKVIWMFCILAFFLGFWVRSHYPEYRHVVNSLLWIVWDIPDDYDWSMMYLRRNAQETRARLIEREVQKRHDNGIGADASGYVGTMNIPPETHTEIVDDAGSDSDAESYATADSSTSVLGGLDILSFRCQSHGLRGRLVIYSDGLRFERLGKEKWRRTWIELVEIRKMEFGLAPGLPKADGLTLIFTDGNEIRLEGVKGRDRVFNCIIGFSGLEYQVLTPNASLDCNKRAMAMRDGMRLGMMTAEQGSS